MGRDTAALHMDLSPILVSVGLVGLTPACLMLLSGPSPVPHVPVACEWASIWHGCGEPVWRSP